MLIYYVYTLYLYILCPAEFDMFNVRRKKNQMNGFSRTMRLYECNLMYLILFRRTFERNKVSIPMNKQSSSCFCLYIAARQ